MTTFLSAIIPTLNRVDAVHRALLSVRAQSYPAEAYEIILVDNGSTDGTAQLVQQLNQDGGKPIRYVYEKQPGAHSARNTAAREAKGTILAYTDDDAEVTPGWLAGLAAAYDDPKLGAAGGPIRVRWRTQPPDWVPPLGTFGHLDYGPDYKELSWPSGIYAGNYSVRKEALFAVGGFNPDTSVEDRLVGDGEIGLCRKLYAAGWKIAYVPSALVYHVQNGAAITLANMRHRYAQMGRFWVYAEYKAERHGRLQLLRRAAGKLRQSASQKLRAIKHWPAKDLAYYQSEVNAAAAIAGARYYLRLALRKHFRQVVLCEDWLHTP